MNAPQAPESLELIERITALIEDGDLAALKPLLEELHASDVADVVESLEGEERLAILRILPVDLASDALAEMEEGEGAGELLVSLGPAKRVELIQELEVDDVVDLVGELEPEDQDRILADLPTEEAVEIRDLLEYDEETAGGIMDTALVSISAHISAAQAIEQVRLQGREVEDFFNVFVVDGNGQLLGTVPLDDLILAEPDETVDNIIEPATATVRPDEDQEEVGKLISHYNLASIPVIADDGRLLGRVTFDDVIDVLEAEQTEDLLKFSGVSDEEEIRGGWLEGVKGRLPWLLLHTLTLSVAVSIVAVFEETVDQLWYLAMLMPLIAGLGGNAGTQALAVTVRTIATSGGPLERKQTMVGKELLVALFNGAVVALVIGIGATVIGQNAMLGVVVLMAMWGNIVVAGFAGAFIPTLLHRIGADPAVASSVFLTTLTDLFGFFLLLGLASALLL
jgi:magnesium transporter